MFAHLLETNAAIELQITQEYLGQQCHLVYLGPLWKEILEFDLRINNEEYRVRDVLEGKRPDKKRSLGGYAGVVNAGSDLNWMGSHLAMSNLYAFGRLAWNHNQESEGKISFPFFESQRYINHYAKTLDMNRDPTGLDTPYIWS